MRNVLNKVIGMLGKKGYQIDVEIGSYNLFIIVFGKGIQLIRGLIYRPFFKKSGILFLGKNANLKHCNKITLGTSVTIESGVEINALTKNGIKIGNNVTIRSNTVVDPGLMNNIGEGLAIGNNVGISQNCFIQASAQVSIGDNVIIGPGTFIYSENHRYESTTIPINEQGVIRKAVQIEDGTWIGSNVVILGGVRVGKHSIIAASAVVTRDVAPYSIVGGIPAKLIKTRK